MENLTELSEQNGQSIVKPTFYSKIVVKMGNCKKVGQKFVNQAGRNKQAGRIKFVNKADRNKQAEKKSEKSKRACSSIRDFRVSY